MSRRKIVSIIGGADCTKQEYEIAEQVGILLGEAGVIVVCGGRGGIMEAVCYGAQKVGGLTIGILPDHDPNSGNPYLDIALPTGLGNNRNLLVAQAGEVVIAIGGGYGTLSEIGIALKSGREVIGINTWTAADKFGKNISIRSANNAEEAVQYALEIIMPES
jgi:uncharacterized protein (TIGR00725 family)